MKMSARVLCRPAGEPSIGVRERPIKAPAHHVCVMRCTIVHTFTHLVGRHTFALKTRERVTTIALALCVRPSLFLLGRLPAALSLVAAAAINRQPVAQAFADSIDRTRHPASGRI